MVPFQDVLRQVRRGVEEATPEDLRRLLEELADVRVLSRDYFLSLSGEDDAEDLARRISLPLWQNWDACHRAVQRLLLRGPPASRPSARGSEMEEMALDLQENPDWLSHEELPIDSFPQDLLDIPVEDFIPLIQDVSLDIDNSPQDLLDIPGRCFSPFQQEDSLDIDLTIIDQYLHEGEKGHFSDVAAEPTSPAKSQPVEPEKKHEGPRNGKRGLPVCMSSAVPKKAKRRRRDTVSPEKGGVTAPPAVLQFGPCAVPQFLQVPVFLPSPGGPSLQVIQAFAPVPQQMVQIPVAHALGPRGPTYVLVPSSLVVMTSPQATPQSPVAGAVVPPDLTVRSPRSSDCADKAWPGTAVSTPSPVTEEPSIKRSMTPTTRVPPPPDTDRCVAEYIERAKSLMRAACERTTSDPAAVPFKSLYVDVGVVKRQVQASAGRNGKRCLERELVVLGDGDRRRATLARGRVFEEEEEGPRRRGPGASIALLGESGAGKTAFVRRLCLDWAEGGLPRFDFLFLLEGRGLNAARAGGGLGLRDLLFDVSAGPELGPEDADAVFRRVLAGPRRVLVVFDGFDDLRDCDGLLLSPATSVARDDYSAKQLFSGLFQKRILAGCTLMVAARPKEALNPCLGKVDRILEVPGFSPADVELYASRYFAGSPCRDRALRRLREGGYAPRLCANPLLCRLACFLLEREGGAKALPSTLTGLCEAVTHARLSAIGRGAGAGPGRRRRRAAVSRLCRAAWEGMKSHDSRLTAADGELSPAELRELEAEGGILARHARRRGDAGPAHGFAHTLTQSYLAALNLALSRDVISRTLVAQVAVATRKRKVPADWLDLTHRFAMATVLRDGSLFQDCFARGGGGRRHAEVKRAAVTAHLRRLSACERSPAPAPAPARLLELCHCVFEAGDARLARRLSEGLPRRLSLRGARLAPPDVFVLRQLLALAARGSLALDLEETGVGVSGLGELLGLESVASFRACLGDVISLWEELQKTNAEGLLGNVVSKFRIDPFKATRLSHIDDLTRLIQIYREKTLPSSDRSQSEPTLDNDSFCTRAVRNLQRLDFELGAQNGPSGLLKLVKILPDLRWLQHLDLEDNKMGDGGAEMLAEVLPALLELRMLNLSQNCIGDGGVATLAPALSSLPALLSLSLYSNLIGDGGAENLAAVLPRMTSLTDLDVKYNRFSDSGAMMLSESMRSCPWMKTIGMWNHFIPHGVLERLNQQDTRIRTL